MPMRPVLAGLPAADPRRGEIYEVNLDPAKGREQKGQRYCVVVSNDALNKSGLGIAIVCTLTTKHKPSFRWRPELAPADVTVVDPTWPVETSYVQTDQVLTLDVEEGRFRRHVGTVHSAAKLAQITKSLYLLLGT
jgi:mRNA interferase MazF